MNDHTTSDNSERLLIAVSWHTIAQGQQQPNSSRKALASSRLLLPGDRSSDDAQREDEQRRTAAVEGGLRPLPSGPVLTHTPQ